MIKERVLKAAKKVVNQVLSKRGYIITRSHNLNSAPPAEEIKQEPDPQAVARRQSKNFATKYQKYAETHKKRRLHFGCGPRVLKDWVNIDLDFEPYEKYMDSYTDVYYPASIRGSRRDFYKFDVTLGPLPIPDNSVDVIFHEDFLEHIHQRDQVAFLAETLRVLKKGGVHRINTPELVSSMKTNSRFKQGFIGTHFAEWDNHQHVSVLSRAMLEELALMVGYSKVIFNEKNKSISKDMPLEYRPNPKTRKSDNIHVDLVK